MKASDLRDMTEDELRSQLMKRSEDLISFRLQMATGVVDNVRGSRNARRDIARIKTVLRERELAAQNQEAK